MKISPLTTLNLKNPGNSADINKQDKLKTACKEFEALVIKQMLTTMRQSIPKEGLLSGGYGEDMFQGLLDDELAQKMADNGGMGFADKMYEQLSQQLQLKSQKR